MRRLLPLSGCVVVVLLGCSQREAAPQVRYVPVPAQAPVERAPALQPAPVQTVNVVEEVEDDSMEDYWEDREERMDCQAAFHDENPYNDPPGDFWSC